MDCCGKSKNSKYILLVVGLITLSAVGFSLTSCGRREVPSGTPKETAVDEIAYYTCGMHPSVKVSVEEYKKNAPNCPICNMKLVPVYGQGGEDTYYGCGMRGKEHVYRMRDAEGKDCPICGMVLKRLSEKEADELKGVVGKVVIKGKEAQLAGIRSEPVRRLKLFKEIRTVGKVAYDPELVIAQEEFVSAVKASEKMQQGNILEIKERADNLVASSRRKLRLLGLSEEQINELEETKDIQTSLILPEDKMWVYGDVYEYELSWLAVGEKVKVRASSLPGEEFDGIISSINPVLNPKTRSVIFRAEIENRGLRLKPEMYVDIIIMSRYKSPAGEENVLAIPKDALLDTGIRKIVWVDTGTGSFEGRAVDVGPEAVAMVGSRSLKFYPILKGLSEGEVVVTKANFLIDSQSQISGVASSEYSGAIDAVEKKGSAGHQH